VLYQTDVIHNHVNLHRNSINLRKAEGSDSKFQLEFSFDCEVDCKLKIWYSKPSVPSLTLSPELWYSDQINLWACDLLSTVPKLEFLHPAYLGGISQT